jgi:FixJ family two-component response regulator
LLADLGDSPGCIVLDVYMPGPSGIELLDALATREFAPPVIFVTGCNDVPTSVHAMKSGAVDFLTKPVVKDKLLYSVRNAIELDRQQRARRDELRILRARYATLSERECQVFVGVVSGKLNKQLAATLNTCERTIKAHRAHVMEKMHTSSLAQLVRTAQLLELMHVDADKRECSSA